MVPAVTNLASTEPKPSWFQEPDSDLPLRNSDANTHSKPHLMPGERLLPGTSTDPRGSRETTEGEQEVGMANSMGPSPADSSLQKRFGAGIGYNQERGFP